MVMDIFEGLPGMPGLFMASLFSASLRLVFTHLNHLIPCINVHNYCFDMFKWSCYSFQCFVGQDNKNRSFARNCKLVYVAVTLFWCYLW